MSQILFCLICVSAFWCFSVADKKNNRVFLWLGIIVIVFASGLRKYNVGVDTRAYVESFWNRFNIPWLFTEKGFRNLSNILMNCFNNNATWLLFIYAAITNILILLRLWDFRENGSFKYMAFLYLTINYIHTMNIMRQFIAIALIFYATRFLERKKYLVFILFFCAAVSIHSTAVLGMVIFVLYLWDNLSARGRKYILIPLLIATPLIANYMLIIEAQHINNYFSQNIENVNITYFYRMIIFFVTMFLQYSYKNIIVFKKNLHNSVNARVSPMKWSDKEVIICAMGLLVGMLGMFYSVMTRAGMYYLMYELVYWGKAVKKGKSKHVAFLLSFTFAVYVFARELIYNGSKIFPYGIHWF